MARDPLRILLSVRRLAVEQARHALGLCQAKEAEVAEKIASVDAATRRDREIGGLWQDAHQFLEMAVIRSETRQAERRALEVDLAAAVDRSTAARGVVTAARTAAEAVAQLAAMRAAEAEAELVRKEQHVLDDIARARRGLRQADELVDETGSERPVSPAGSS